MIEAPRQRSNERSPESTKVFWCFFSKKHAFLEVVDARFRGHDGVALKVVDARMRGLDGAALKVVGARLRGHDGVALKVVGARLRGHDVMR
jgi:hypothetical protein